MEKELTLTAANGITYKFVEWMIFGHATVSTYSMWDGEFHHICKTFNNLEEAKAWQTQKSTPSSSVRNSQCFRNWSVGWQTVRLSPSSI